MNPEKPVIDDIDALIAAGLDEHGVPRDDYNADRYDRCELCQGHWHGLPRNGCPGGYATPAQHTGDIKPEIYIGQYATEYHGVPMMVHLYLGAGNGFVGLMIPVPPSHRSGYSCDLFTFDEATAMFILNPPMPQPDSESDTP